MSYEIELIKMLWKVNKNMSQRKQSVNVTYLVLIYLKSRYFKT